MRVGVDTYSYHRLLGLRRPGEPPAPLASFEPGWRDVVAEVGGLGVDVLALQTMFLPDPRELDVDALRAAMGPMEVILSWGGAEGLSSASEREAIAELEAWLALAAPLGCRLVRIVAGGPALRVASPAAERLRRTAPVLARAAAAAATAGVALCVEDHGDLAALELAELLDRAGAEDVGVCLDVANALRVGDDPVRAAELFGSRVRMVHLRDCDDPAHADPVSGPRVRAYGEGVVPIDAVLAALRAQAFEGPICVELAQLGPGDDERALVAGCVEWLRRRASADTVGNDTGSDIRTRRFKQMRTQEVATNLGWPEGPSVLDDGRVVYVETYRSRIGVWSWGGGAAEYAFTGGGPNATALGADGCLYLTQNGGVVGPWRATDPRPPSIQRISVDGSVDVICTEVEGIRLQAPNDLAFAPDGRLYFTDPGRFDIDVRPDPGYLFALAPDGAGELIAELGNTYPNGIAVEQDGSVVWVESYTRAIKRRCIDGATENVCILPEAHLPDGLAIAQDGRLFITVTAAGGLDVVAPDGGIVEFLAVGTVPTNCVFSGSTLFVTDGGQSGTGNSAEYGGVLWKVELDDAAGLNLFRGSIAPAPQ